MYTYTYVYTLKTNRYENAYLKYSVHSVAFSALSSVNVSLLVPFRVGNPAWPCGCHYRSKVWAA